MDSFLPWTSNLNWTLRPSFYTQVQNFCVSQQFFISIFDFGAKQKLCPKKFMPGFGQSQKSHLLISILNQVSFYYFRQKLRGAVYDALADQGITQWMEDNSTPNPLFRPCFKRLYAICISFDMPRNTPSVKQFLGTIAKTNAAMVINLEKQMLRNK